MLTAVSPGDQREIHRPLSLTDPPYMHGPDVQEVQQSIAKDFAALKLPIALRKVDGEFGPRSKRKMNRCLFFLGVDPAGNKPAGPVFTEEEQRYVRNPDSRSKEQLDRSKRRVDEFLKSHAAAGGFDGIRAKIVETAVWGVDHEPSIHYAQVRPIPHTLSLPMSTDCSGFATLSAEIAKAPDPNGFNYSGYGFTGTILSGCEHIEPSECKPGDLIVYGPGDGHHVVIAIEAGANPMTVSHGQEKGPLKIRHGDEDAYQPEPDTFCRFLDD